jgi:rod shape-determining protein MreC
MHILSFLFEKHLDKTVLAVAVAMSIAFLTRTEESKINAARSVTSFLLYPVDRIGGYFNTIEELGKENRKLKGLVATLYHERERYVQFGRERNRLRELIGLRRDTFYELMPCEVIAHSANRFHNSVTVDRGSRDGVKAGMSVVGYRGLVGRVVQVFPRSSMVLLLSNKSVSVSCQVARSRVVGILEWERGNIFRLEFIGKEEDVQPGDTLQTSGLGGLFPKGFTVGTVFRVAEEKTGLSRQVGVVCMSDLNTLEELFVVVSGRDWDSRELLEQLGGIDNK